jgi:hypothetical protein
VCLSSDRFTIVDAGELGPEERALNDRETVAWKWSLDFEESFDRSKIRYCLQLSSLRRTCVGDSIADAVNIRYRLSGRERMSGVEWKKRYFPRIKRDETVFLADSLLFSQFFLPDNLPRYEDDLSVVPSYEESTAQVVEAVVA